MTSPVSKKRIVVFASDHHSGQLNPVLTIAREFWRLCDQSKTEIHFISNDEGKGRIEEALPTVRFISTGASETQSIGGSVQAPGFYENVFRGKPASVRATVDIFKLILDRECYRIILNNTIHYLEKLSQKPVLAIVDAMSLPINDAMRLKKIDRIVNIPFNAHGCLDVSTLGQWSFPNAGTGYSNQMNLFQKLHNRFYLLAVKARLLPTVFNLARLRSSLAGIPYSEISDYVGISNTKHFLIDTIYGFEYSCDLPVNSSMIGACIDAEGVDAEFDANLKKEPILSWLEKHPRVLFIGLGTITKLTKEYVLDLLSAFQRLRVEQPDIQLLFKIPKDCYRPKEGESILENVRVVNYLHSQLEVLKHKHVRVFVSHCGGNSVHEAIYYGKVVLGLPQWTDCYDFAQRVEDSGIGLRAKKTIPSVDPSEVYTMLLQLLDNKEFQNKADYFSAKMKKAGGIKKATDIIFAQLGERPPNNSSSKTVGPIFA